MEKDDQIWIDHIREAITIVENHLGGMSYEEFKSDITAQDAVVRRIEIIGEAANNISSKFQGEHPSVEWRKIIGMRNVLAHEYFGVDLKIVWNTIKLKLPELKEELS